ncbi:MAG: alpha/beta hydrolase [Bdellovibrionales bacterium]|nr:alpha/beta hydrolase [Bdellovibrionales bacterium]
MNKLVVSAALACALSACATSKPIVKPTRAPVNGLKMYYEIHGTLQTGQVPLVLIHGGGSTIDSTWGRMIPFLSKTRQIIAIEEQSHGRTADIDRVESFENTASDIVALLKFLKIPQVDVMGFSNGATTSLVMGIHYPAWVRKIIPASGIYARAGIAIKGFWKSFNHATLDAMPAQLKADFLRVNPDPAALQKMFERDVYRMVHFKDIPTAQIKKITAPTLVMTASSDVATVEHARKLASLVQHGQYMVFPGAHGQYIGESEFPADVSPNAAQATALIVDDFLR